MADMILKIIVLTLGIFALMESLAIMLFPKSMLEIGRKWMKHVRHMRKIAFIELIVALAFILVGLFLL